MRTLEKAQANLNAANMALAIFKGNKPPVGGRLTASPINNSNNRVKDELSKTKDEVETISIDDNEKDEKETVESGSLSENRPIGGVSMNLGPVNQGSSLVLLYSCAL